MAHHYFQLFARRQPNSAARAIASRRVQLSWLVLVIVRCLFATLTHAQVVGTPPLSSIDGGQYDTINLSNLMVLVHIPVRNKAGAIPFNYVLTFNFYERTNPPPERFIWIPFNDFRSTVLDSAGATSPSSLAQCPLGGQTTVYQQWSIVDSGGTYHPVPGALYDTKACLGSGGGVTTDGSGYALIFTGSGSTTTITIYDRSGNLVGEGAITDPNGNAISASSSGSGSNLTTSYTDTLGQLALTNSHTFNSTLNETTDAYTYTDSAKTPQSFTVTSPPSTFQTAFGCGTPEDFTGDSAIPWPASVSLPDGSSLSFTFEPTSPGSSNITGRLQSITLPTLGKITYAYSGGTNGINCSDGSTPILKRTTPDGTWTYVHTPPVSGSTISTTTITDPSGNRTSLTFSGNYETQRLVYQSSGKTLTLAETILTCYNGNFTNCASTSVSTPITRVDRYRTITGGKTALSETFFNGVGMVTQQNEFGYGVNTGAAPTGAPLRATETTYATISGINPYIQDRPSCVQVTAGASPLVCSTVTSNTISITNYLNYDSKGNVGTIEQWVGGSSHLSRSFTYNSNGTVATSTDVNGTVTSPAYNGTGGCNGVLPTSTTAGGLTTSYVWDCNGGVMTQISDANSQPVQFGYDMMWRVTSVTDPQGNIRNTKYTPAATSTPATVETYLNFPTPTPTSTVDSLDILDGLGRLAESEKRTAPGATTFDNAIQYSYGYTTSGTVLGPFTKQTVPGGTATTVTQIDALGRTASVTDGGGGTQSLTYAQNDALSVIGPAPSGENAKQRQLEYDVLGRLTSVCEISSSLPGTGTCSQVSSSPKGYFTKYTYDSPTNSFAVAQNAQGAAQNRSYQSDGIGRLTSETNPESGTTTYTYDSDSSGKCAGTFNGDLVKRVDNAGNIACYTYDGLHRKTSVTYPFGPNVAGTPNKCFVYDAAIDGNAATNTKGRLAEGYTTTNACSSTTLPSVITDEAFSYTARGEQADFYESTPNSGGYYSVPISYWANGLIKTFGPFLTEDQSGYTPDGEGRARAVGNSVPTITYSAASQPTQLSTSCNKGTCYPITYTYDQNTQRMTGYSAALADGTISGSLKWNPNGSLQQLVIADPFNSTDVQTCSYSADDLSRIASVNCVNGSTNVWGQTFSYDVFGNVSKSGSSSWIPGYNASTNQYALSGTTYDADGNLLNDSFNKYTWDAEGKPLSTAYSNGQTFAFVYDAFGHKVESSVNGTYQDSYVTLGKFKLSAHGQTPMYSEFPVPGASILGNLGGGTGVKLADWLGTVRAFYSYTGGGYSSSGAHAPFGESYGNNGTPLTDFTGQESDGNGNTTYYFPERHYRSTEGRWLSPDPAGLGTADFSNPQSWNRYAYVMNNPLSNVDPQGTFVLGIEWAWYQCGFCTFGSTWDEFELANGWDKCENGDCSHYHFINSLGLIDFAFASAAAKKPVPGSQPPSAACQYFVRSICSKFDILWWKDNKKGDLAVFNLTGDPYFWANGGAVGALFGQIAQLEQINLAIDAVGTGDQVLSTLDSVPGVPDLLPPGIDKAEDAGLDFFVDVRNENNVKVDQLLENVLTIITNGNH